MSSGGLSTPGNDSPERLAYLALALIPGLGARRMAKLLSGFGSATSVLDASIRELIQIESVTLALATSIDSASIEDARGVQQRLASRGHFALVPADPQFPSSLRCIPDPPVLLFARGPKLDALAAPSVAIVGSREHSRYGSEIADLMGRTAGEAGIPVVSGMARGLDAIAQLAALDAGGASVGVLGTGGEVVYPRENKPLFDRMEIEGVVITEHPPGDRSRRGAFPRRNRLISGLARALVVVEAAEASGTLITVASALEQGREVLVVPGPIDSPTSKGTNRLIRDGATPLLSPEDLLSVFGVSSPARPELFSAIPCNLSPAEALTLGVLSADPRRVDDIAMAAGLPIGLVLGTLVGLELGALAEQLPDGSYRRR